MKKSLFIFLLGIFSVFSAFAQTTIKGSVKDAITNEPIPDQEVGDILLKSVTHTGSLQIDEQSQRTVRVTLPVVGQLIGSFENGFRFAAGNWYITPFSDAYDVVTEDTRDQYKNNRHQQNIMRESKKGK